MSEKMYVKDTAISMHCMKVIQRDFFVCFSQCRILFTPLKVSGLHSMHQTLKISSCCPCISTLSRLTVLSNGMSVQRLIFHISLSGNYF